MKMKPLIQRELIQQPFLKKHEEMMKWNDCMENNDDNQCLEKMIHPHQVWSQALHSCWSRLEEKPFSCWPLSVGIVSSRH